MDNKNSRIFIKEKNPAIITVEFPYNPEIGVLDGNPTGSIRARREFESNSRTSGALRI